MQRRPTRARRNEFVLDEYEILSNSDLFFKFLELFSRICIKCFFFFFDFFWCQLEVLKRLTLPAEKQKFIYLYIIIAH
jgi:hypothetical protein